MFDPVIPRAGHSYPRLSPDGRLLAYVVQDAGQLGVLDLVTGTSRIIEIQPQLPANVSSLGCSRVVWSPYDNSVVLAWCADLTDTGTTSPIWAYGQNYYRISLATGELRRMTPSTYGPSGSEHGLGIPIWLEGSTPSSDSILTYFYNSEHPGSTWRQSDVGVYVPQIDSILPTSYPEIGSQSRTGRHLASFVGVSEGPPRLFVDGSELTFDPAYGSIEYTSWSPDESRLAISVGIATGSELWIVDIDRWLRTRLQPVPVTALDFRAQHCKMSPRGLSGEFITNTTLAVSFNDPGDEITYLWEVRDDGTILRRLTSQ